MTEERKYTMKQACEHIEKAEIVSNGFGKPAKAMDIFTYSSSGELSKIFEWFQLAVDKIGWPEIQEHK